MAILSKEQIKTNIQTELADNNAGAISAFDVRHNMEDIVDSINQIVASGDFDASTPFTGSNVRAKRVNNQFGAFIAESGVIFPFADGGGSTRQLIAYNGPSSVDHNGLSNLTVGDVHTQYLPLAGTRVMVSNIGLGNNWINSSGNSPQPVTSNNKGFRFQYVNNDLENIRVGNKSRFVFDTDNSVMSSAKGVAKAWLNFEVEAGVPIIKSYHNIHKLEKLEAGKYKVEFTSGVFADNSYVAMANSNARSTSASQEDFSINKVGLTLRQGDDAAALRSLSFVVMDDGGQYVDAKINELVVYGRSPGEGSGIHPIVVTP
jgi:hypothetical protein